MSKLLYILKYKDTFSEHYHDENGVSGQELQLETSNDHKLSYSCGAFSTSFYILPFFFTVNLHPDRVHDSEVEYGQTE